MNSDKCLLEILPAEAHETTLALIGAMRRRVFQCDCMSQAADVYMRLNFLMDPKISKPFTALNEEETLRVRNVEAAASFIDFIDPQKKFFKRKHMLRDVQILAMLCEGVQHNIIPIDIYRLVLCGTTGSSET